MASSQPSAAIAKNKGKQGEREQSPANASTSVIAEGTVIEGNFSSEESIRIDGTVVGEIRCDKRLVIGVTGKVEGNLFAHDGVIKGTVEGAVQVQQALHLEGTAVVSGSIQAGSISVDEGASFNGDSQMPNRKK